MEQNKDDFFSIGKDRTKENLAPEENKDVKWKDIRPVGQFDALQKQAFKKRKYDEFMQMVEEKRKKKANKKQYFKADGKKAEFETKRFKPNNPQQTSAQQVILNHKQRAEQNAQKSAEQLQREQLLKFQQEIKAALDGDQQFNSFIQAFKKYRSDTHPNIDTFVEDLFETFFGHRTLAICYLEINNYLVKKQVLIKLDDKVQARHLDRYRELIQVHFQACLVTPRSIVPLNLQQKKVLKTVDQSPSKVSGSQNSNQDKISCMICYKTEKLYSSKCEHYACIECWDAWLDKTLECPTCRTRVRKNQIFPLQPEQAD